MGPVALNVLLRGCSRQVVNMPLGTFVSAPPIVTHLAGVIDFDRERRRFGSLGPLRLPSRWFA
jgi:hypothetical protein